MAVAFDGFSIRAYTAKMRTDDAAKSWPFKSDDGNGVAERLPPMAVAKFRWWSHELARLRRRQTPSSSSPPELSPAKPKSKRTKKRSIAEIFAVAPQIERDRGTSIPVADSEDCLRELRNEIKKKKNKKLLGKAKIKSNCVGVSIDKKKKIITRKKNCSKIAIQKDSQKFKAKKHASFSKKLKKFALNILNSDSASGQNTSTQDMAEVEEPSRLVLENQEPTLPVRSILKSHTSCEPKSTIHNMNQDLDPNPCGTQSSEKHVRFSGGNDVLGLNRTYICSTGQNVEKSLSDAIAASSETAKSSENDEDMEVDDGPLDEIEVQPVISVESGDSPCVELSIPAPTNTRAFPEKIACSTSQGLFYNNNSHMVNDENYPHSLPGFTCTPRLFPTFDTSRVSTQVSGSGFRTANCNVRLTDHIQEPVYTVAELNNPMEIQQRRLLEPVSFLPVDENNNHRIQSQLRHDEELVNDQITGVRPYWGPYPMDLIGGLNSLPQPEWQRNSVVLRKRSSNDNFIGLPLNSQGELIQSSSRPKCLYNDMAKTNMIGSSSGFFPSHSQTQQPGSTGDYLGLRNDQENLYLAQNYARESQSFHMPARLGVTSWENSGRADINHQLDFDQRSNCSYLPYDGTRYSPKMNEAIHPMENSGKLSLNTGQPTMRLMGKDVLIGKSGHKVNGFEDGNLWTDKEMVSENCTSNFHEWIPVGKYNKETVVQPQSHAHREMATQNHFLVHPVGSGLSHCYPTGPNYLPFAHLPPNSSAIFDGAPRFRDFFVSEAEPLQMRSHQLTDPYEQVQWRPANLTTTTTHLPHFPKPGSGYPFADYHHQQAQLPWFDQSPGQSLPSWLLHAKQQGKTPMISSSHHHHHQQHHHQNHQYHHQQPQQISSRTNIVNTPSVYSAPSINALRSHQAAANADYRNRMKEHLKSKALGVKDPYPFKKTSNKNLNSVDFIDLESCDNNRLAVMNENVLRPNQQGVEVVENFFPVRPTIPFVPGASITRVAHQESQNNVTKIYRF